MVNYVGIRDLTLGSLILVKSDIDPKLGEKIIYTRQGFEFLGEVASVSQLEALCAFNMADAKITRYPTSEDLNKALKNQELEKNVERIFIESCKINNLNLDYFGCRFSLCRSKIKLYYYCPQKINFNGLIKTILSKYPQRVKLELVQISGREYALASGGIGVCGNEICCHRLNIKSPQLPKNILMTKGYRIMFGEESIGICGARKCCSIYELDEYERLLDSLPDCNSFIYVDKKRYKVIDANVFTKMVTLIDDKKARLELSFDEVRSIYGSEA